MHEAVAWLRKLWPLLEQDIGIYCSILTGCTENNLWHLGLTVYNLFEKR